jgi:hypothetical protein
MQKQIANDLSLGKISLQAINATQQAIRERHVISTHRYRIVDNKLYRYFGPISATEPMVWFENGLRTLIELAPQPNLDFLVTFEDGTRDPFYQLENPDLQAPVLGWAKLTSTPFLVLIPDYRSLSTMWHGDIRKLTEGKSYVGEPVPWDRKEEIAFWRGGLTDSGQRLKIASLCQQFPSLVDAGISVIQDPPLPYFKPHASYEEHLQYKYLPVIDGIMCTYPGYQWRLLSDAVVFKQQSDQIQWFYGALEPYVHYVPIKNDLSDLIDQIKWARENDDTCKQISSNATEFALKNLMYDDIYYYLHCLFASYSELQDESFNKDWEITDSSPCWTQLSQS